MLGYTVDLKGISVPVVPGARAEADANGLYSRKRWTKYRIAGSLTPEDP